MENNGIPNEQETKVDLNTPEVQSLIDRRVTEALKTARSKWEKDYNSRLEAEKLSTMNREELYQHQLQQKEIELNEKMTAFNKELLKNETAKVLDSRKLPVGLLDYVIGNDAEDTKLKIDNLSSIIEDLVNVKVQERVRINGINPTKGVQSYKDITKEDFQKMGYIERMEIYKKDPNLFNKLIK